MVFFLLTEFQIQQQPAEKSEKTDEKVRTILNKEKEKSEEKSEKKEKTASANESLRSILEKSNKISNESNKVEDKKTEKKDQAPPPPPPKKDSKTSDIKGRVRQYCHFYLQKSDPGYQSPSSRKREKNDFLPKPDKS